MKNQKWRISRANRNTGFTETVWFTGPKHLIPKGWKIVNHPDNGKEDAITG